MICLQIQSKLSANVASSRNSRLQPSGVSAILLVTVPELHQVNLELDVRILLQQGQHILLHNNQTIFIFFFLNDQINFFLFTVQQVKNGLYPIYLHQLATYTSQLPTLASYLHLLATYTSQLPTLASYLHLLSTYTSQQPTLASYLHQLATWGFTKHSTLFVSTMAYIHYRLFDSTPKSFSSRRKEVNQHPCSDRKLLFISIKTPPSRLKER